jgi:hypothetical protein
MLDKWSPTYSNLSVRSRSERTTRHTILLFLPALFLEKKQNVDLVRPSEARRAVARNDIIAQCFPQLPQAANRALLRFHRFFQSCLRCTQCLRPLAYRKEAFRQLMELIIVFDPAGDSLNGCSILVGIVCFKGFVV